MKSMNDVKMQSLGKALRILDYFQVDRPEGTVTEISDYFGYTKSNVYNILQTLESFGYVEQDPKTKEYRLGYAILRRSFVYNQTNDKLQRIQEYLSATANEVNELANFATIRDHQLLYLGQCIPKNRQLLLTDYANVVGYSAPLYCTGLGKAMLAYQSADYVDEIIAEGFEEFTETTVRSGEQLKRELAHIRELGYAVDNMEHSYGVRCVAVPVLNAAGEAVFAISLRGISVQFTDDRIEELARALKQCTREIKKHISL
ncbi:MAG: IclR family transcriptional regulator [Aristaeellaceae bacterium]|nr:IclR family transcriptional regulator [Eubacteriales bacterium]